MAKKPAPRTEKPRTQAASPVVRGFLNAAAPLPSFGAVGLKESASLFEGAAEVRGLHFGRGNTVPVVAMAAKQASPTAYRCIERRTQFLVGTGFAVPERNAAGQLVDPSQASTLGDTPVPGHPGKTANDLWAELCSYGGDFNACAVLVRYTNGSLFGEHHVLPFGSVRKTTAGTYLLNHKFGRKGFQSSETTEHLPFDPSKKTVLELLRKAKEINPKTGKPYGQPGQIYFIYTPKAGEEDYPLPPQWPGLDALLKEAAYQSFDLTEVRRGFLAKGVLVTLGELDDSVKDENGQTDQERQDELLRRFTVEGALEQGEERESILVMNAATKDAAPIWIPLNTTTDLKWLSEKLEAVGQEICRHIGMSPVLAGFAKPGQLGNVQELANTVAYTQATLEPLRQLLLRAFWRLMPTLAGLVPGKLSPIAVAATLQQQAAPPTHA